MSIVATTEGDSRLTRTSPRKQLHLQGKEVSNPEGTRNVVHMGYTYIYKREFFFMLMVSQLQPQERGVKDLL